MEKMMEKTMEKTMEKMIEKNDGEKNYIVQFGDSESVSCEKK